MKVLEPSLTDEDLDRLECDTFRYFAAEMNPENGLVADSTKQGASVVAVLNVTNRLLGNFIATR